MENLYRPAIAGSFGRRLKDYVTAAAADPSLVYSNYVLPPDYKIMSETAEVFMKAMLLGMAPEAGRDFADTEPVEILPYEEALAYTRKRLPVDAETYYALDDKMRYRAFTVSRLADGDSVKQVQNMLSGALEEGTGLSGFLQMTEGELADAAGMGRGSGWYYETVYRTNTSAAYNAGRAIGFEENPPIALELIGIDDTRQTELCHSLTAPPFRRPYGDPVWESLWPPFHFNCRTTVRGIYDQEEIDGAGGPDKFYTKGAPDYTPDKGFGAYPVDKGDSWWDLTDAMKERAQEYGLEAEFLEAKDLLVGGPLPDDPQRAAEIRAAEDYARNNLGAAYADYAGIDPAVANEWNAHLGRTLKEFPELKDTIKFTGSTGAQDKIMEPALDHIRLEKARQQFSGKPEPFLKLKAAEYKIADAKKLNPDGMISRNISASNEKLKQFSGIAINSEYGGSISVMEKQLTADVAAGFRPHGTATVKAAFDHEAGHQLDHLLGLRKDPDMIESWNKYSRGQKVAGLSKYGAEKIEDFIAEGWAEYCNNPMPRPLSKEIGSLILKKYRLWKG